MMIDLLVKILNSDANLPRRGSEGAIGLDLYAAEDTRVLPKNPKAVSTGIAVAIPSGHYGRIAPRSGLAFKYGVDVLAGVIDEDYRGEIKVIIAVHGYVGVSIKKGDRIAQLILERATKAHVIQVDELDETERGAGGFGSTGK